MSAVQGPLYMMGTGAFGKLGLGDEETAETGKEVVVLQGKLSAAVACGSFHTATVTADGKLFTWGGGSYGRLGHADRFKKLVPKAVSGLFSREVKAVGCGFVHSAVVTADGKMFTWGGNRHGQLGHGTPGSELQPREVKALEGKSIRSLAVGYFHTCAVTTEGHMYTWGLGCFGRLGHGDRGRLVKPKAVAALYGKDVRALAAGYTHTTAVTAEGHLYTWGGNSYGQLGHGGVSHEFAPRQVAAFGDKQVSQIACGAHHTLAVLGQNELYTWGMGFGGQLGLGDNKLQRTPQVLSALSGGKPIRHVDGGYMMSTCVTGDGELYLWGRLHLALPNKSKFTPEKVPNTPKLLRAACGDEHVALVADPAR